MPLETCWCWEVVLLLLERGGTPETEALVVILVSQTQCRASLPLHSYISDYTCYDRTDPLSPVPPVLVLFGCVLDVFFSFQENSIRILKLALTESGYE